MNNQKQNNNMQVAESDAPRLRQRNPQITRVAGTFGHSGQQDIRMYFQNNVLPYSSIDKYNPDKDIEIKQITLKNGVHINSLDLNKLAELRFHNHQVFKRIADRDVNKCNNCQRTCNMLKYTVQALDQIYQSTLNNYNYKALILTEHKIETIRQKYDKYNTNEFIKLFSYNLKAICNKFQTQIYEIRKEIGCQEANRQLLIEGYEYLLKCQKEAAITDLKGKLIQKQQLIALIQKSMKQEISQLERTNYELRQKLRNLNLDLLVERAKIK